MAVAGLIRLVHPFPILLDALVCGSVAVVAGGDAPTAIRLAAAMLALQASIGALNDVVDAPLDSGRKPGKPIPAGMVSGRLARTVVIGSAGLGLGLTIQSGMGALAVAGVGLAIGYAYDLEAKGTAWSWVPFAVGVPLLPAFGWIGVTKTLPPSFAVLFPAAFLAGAGLAIANALADADRDRAAGSASVATLLGPRRARAIGVALQSTVAAVAIASLVIAGSTLPTIVATTGAAGIVLAGLGLGRSASPAVLERAWEVQAIGIALLGASWLWGIARPG